jgi:Icc-related predicted phosphoesterase
MLRERTDAPTTTATVRVAAAGDLHCRESNRAEIAAAFRRCVGDVDLFLLAGDITTHGEIAEAEVLAAAVAELEVPVFAVLGNHDWHLGHQREIAAVLSEAGVQVLDRGAAVCEARGIEVGVVGAKGFVGGFSPTGLPDFGEPSLRAVYAETTAEVEGLEHGLTEVATCPLRIVLLHYAPVEETLEGEPREIHAFLGSDRLAPPIHEHAPDLVIHGHAHAGKLEGRIGSVPVCNVSVPVIKRDFWTIELEVERDAPGPIP